MTKLKTGALDGWLKRPHTSSEVAKSSTFLDPSKKKKDYETKRAAGATKELRSKWLQRYGWLQSREDSHMVEDDYLLHCKVCLAAGKDNNLSKGAFVTKVDTLNKHEKTEEHKFALLAYENKKDGTAGSQDWLRAVKNANDKSKSAIIAAMNIVYYQAKENVARVKFSSLKELCIDLGVDNLKNLNCDAHTDYESHRSLNDIENAIAMVIHNDIKCALSQCDWFSVCIDESTDVSVIQSAIVYFNVVRNGYRETFFAALNELNEGCNAQSIYDSLLSTLATFDTDLQKLSSISTDGASVMCGVRRGVTTLLKQQLPHLISTHCIAHRLALASSKAADSDPYLIKFQEIMNKSYKYFEYSAKKTNALKDMQNILQESKIKFVQVFGTRWTSFHRSLSAMEKNWAAFVSVLIEDKSAVGQCLLKNITTYKFLAVLSFLIDVVSILHSLCLTFQRQNLTLNTVLTHVKSCYDEIKETATNRKGETYMRFLSDVPDVVTEGIEYKGHYISASQKMKREVDSAITRFSTSLLENLEDRLFDFGTLEMFVFLMPCNIPKVCDETFHNFGDNQIPLIVNHFKNHHKLNDVNAVRNEWKLFKRILSTRCQSMSLSDVVAFMHSNNFVTLYPMMYALYTFLLSVPMSTVDCERGFSVMNVTKTPLRNRLCIANLNTLLTININGPDDRKTFSFEKAFEYWCTQKDRRIMSKL